MRKEKEAPQEKAERFEVLYEHNIVRKFFTFIWRFLLDQIAAKKDPTFNEYGMTAYTGRQGSGKTLSMVVELERIRRDYPDVRILTNFGYIHEDAALTDWQQLVDERNDAGIVFAIDEIQNEFDVYDTRNFNLELLKVITQQRKQGIKIIASSQVFTRVSKPLREQTHEVVECNTLMGRWTFNKAFDAFEYNLVIDNPDPEKTIKVPRLWRRNYIQNKAVRELYDSYAVIQSMKKLAKDGAREQLKA